MDQGSSLNLLPRSREEFASKDYWNDFFVQLKSKPSSEAGEGFEWYGAWEDINPLIVRNGITSPLVDPKVLVVGCGNSDLSEKMYMGGFKNVVSIDFSEVVIEEMKAKTLDKPGLEFLLMDMLNMTPSWEGSYDIIVDKGALDALMGDDDEVSAEQGAKMLAEIDRVLKNGGSYLCVTLLQEHVLRALLNAFPINSTWEVNVHAFEPISGSALCPFLLDIKKASPVPRWHLSFLLNPDERLAASDEVVLDKVNQQRWSYHSKKQLKTLGEGVRGTFNLAATGEVPKGADASRYRITVVDTDVPPGDVLMPCGVFVVPQGREHEWIFSNPEGQMDMAKSNKISRLIFIALGRGHSFESMQAVQAEISSSIMDLAQEHLPENYKIPFLGVGSDKEIGERVTVYNGESQTTGAFVVEDVVMDDPETQKPVTFRRLVFLSNPDAIQSEARMLEGPPSDKTLNSTKSKGSKKKGKGKKKGKKPSNSSPAAAQPPAPPQDDLDLFMTAEELEALGLSEPVDKKLQASSDEESNMHVDENYLAFEVHQAMVAVLGASIQSLLKLPSRQEKEVVKAVVVGLGGGGLAKYLKSKWLPKQQRVHVDAIELDEAVIGVASKLFGCTSEPGLTIHCTDGIAYLNQKDTQANVIVIDVDAKDLTQSMVCPPQEFLSEEFLTHISQNVILPGGCLVINLGARTDKDQTQVLAKLASIFDQVLVIPMEETGNVNSVVLCVPKCTAAWKKQSLATRFAILSSSATSVFHKVSLGRSDAAKNSQDGDFLEFASMIQLVEDSGGLVDVATAKASEESNSSKRR